MHLYLDDVRNGPDFTDVGWENWVIVRSVENAKLLLKTGLIEDMSLDHDMSTNSETGMENDSGYKLVCWMEENNIWPKGIISVHSANPVGRDKMVAVLKKNNRWQ